MLKLTILLFISSSVLSMKFEATPEERDMVKCTESFKDLANDFFGIVQSFKDNEGQPDKKILKHILTSVDNTGAQCFEKDLNLKKFESCVEETYPVFGTFKRLLDDLSKKDYAGMSLDAAQLGL